MTGAVDLTALTKRVDKIGGDTDLRQVDFADVVLALLFFTVADLRFERASIELGSVGARRRRKTGPADFRAHGSFLFPDGTRVDDLFAAPDNADLGSVIATAVRDLVKQNPDAGAVLNVDFRRVPNGALQELLKVCSTVRASGEGAAQEIFNGFLTRYALDEDASSASVGYTPSSVSSLIASVLDLRRGRVLDPYCRGGDLLVAVANSARARHRTADHLSLHGQAASRSLASRAAMNLAANRLEVDITTARPLVDDPFSSAGLFDCVLVNPPFNEDGPDPRAVDGDQRFSFGLPLTRTGSMKKANYLWIQLVYSALKAGGRAAILMPNSAADAGASELDIRRRLIEAGGVEAVFGIGPNFYETGSNPVMLWFLRRPHARGEPPPIVLFVDARNVRTPISRALNTWSPAQVEFLANIARLERGSSAELTAGSGDQMAEYFPEDTYADVAGLCGTVTVDGIAAEGWSLNPGRYVGTPKHRVVTEHFEGQLHRLNAELDVLDKHARALRRRTRKSIQNLIGVVSD